MGRIVRSAEPVPKRDSTLEGIPGDAPLGVDDDKQEDQGSKGGDGYLDRVAKYVPAEVVAFFIFVNSILVNATEQPVAKALTDAVAEETKGNPGTFRVRCRQPSIRLKWPVSASGPFHGSC